jgi:hypothetical protein
MEMPIIPEVLASPQTHPATKKKKKKTHKFYHASIFLQKEKSRKGYRL